MNEHSGEKQPVSIKQQVPFFLFFKKKNHISFFRFKISFIWSILFRYENSHNAFASYNGK